MRLRLAAIAALLLLLIAPIGLHWGVPSGPDRTLPHLAVMRQALDAGHFPFWDRYNYCGRPFAANPQTQSFYPPRWLSVVASSSQEDLPSRLEFEIIAHLLFAGFFTALLARRLSCAWPSSALAGVVYSFGCFFAFQRLDVGQGEACTWLPAICWAVSRMVQRPAFKNVALLAVLLCANFLTGLTPGASIVSFSSALFCIVLAWRAHQPLLPALLRFSGAAVLSVLLAGIQVIPAIELAFYSVGTGGGRNSADSRSSPAPRKPLQGGRYDIVDVAPTWVRNAPLLHASTSNGDDPLALERTMQSRLLIGRMEQPTAPMLEAMNVDLLLADKPLDTSSSNMWELAESGPPLLYKRRNPSQRFFFGKSVIKVDGLRESIAEARKENWSPRVTAIIEQGRLSATTQTSSVGSVSLISERPGEIRLRTDNNGSGFLFVSESYFPGWRARVGNRPTPVVPANVGFQGLFVPAGRHEVVLTYSPTIFAMGGALSLATAIGMALGIAWDRWRKTLTPAGLRHHSSASS